MASSVQPKKSLFFPVTIILLYTILRSIDMKDALIHALHLLYLVMVSNLSKHKAHLFKEVFDLITLKIVQDKAHVYCVSLVLMKCMCKWSHSTLFVTLVSFLYSHIKLFCICCNSCNVRIRECSSLRPTVFL